MNDIIYLKIYSKLQFKIYFYFEKNIWDCVTRTFLFWKKNIFNNNWNFWDSL